MTKKRIIRIIAIVFAVLMPVLTTFVAFAGTEEGAAASAAVGTKYASPDINTLTGHGEEPEDLSVTAGTTYTEKEWYEYITYSEHAVASYRLNENSRLLFYDPYTYTDTMVMEVTDSLDPGFETMSSYTVAHTTSKTVQTAITTSYTETTATQTSGRDETHSEVKNTGDTKTTYNHKTVASVDGSIHERTDNDYFANCDITAYLKANVGVSPLGPTGFVEDSLGYNEHLYVDASDKTTTYDNYKTTTKYTGQDKVEYNTKSETDGWTELSDRITKTIGSSQSKCSTWSESESTTVTKTYAATHFASDGITPLPWKVVNYSVQLPMKVVSQYKIGGEWTDVSYVYCMLTTVQGTCRAWLQNGQEYLEDWGSGEPVIKADFWSQFMTRESVMQSYAAKLYPSGGVR